MVTGGQLHKNDLQNLFSQKTKLCKTILNYYWQAPYDNALLWAR